MSSQTVRVFLAEHAPNVGILEKNTITATVAEAAEPYRVAPERLV